MTQSRKYIVQGVILLVALVFLGKLFQIQVVDERYKLAAQNNTIRMKTLYPYRGHITDRHGNFLVNNYPVFDLMVVLRDAEISDTAEFCNMLGIDKEFLKKRVEEMKADRSVSSYKPAPFMKQIPAKDFARIQDVFDYEGFSFVPRTIRAYPHGSLANALGYVAEIGPSELQRDTSMYYEAGDYIGKSGVEKRYEDTLRGTRGSKLVMVNVKGIEKGAFDEGKFDTLPTPGKNLISTIDINLQRYGERLMQNKIGSIVAIEPATGEILTLVSSPSYDPNKLAGRSFSENFSDLQTDSLKPLFNRATQAPYPPGSVFKLVMALIGMQEEVVSKGTVFPCDKSLVNCHNHPTCNLSMSIQHSCNPYYYRVFQRVIQQNEKEKWFDDAQYGLEKWKRYVQSFGIGTKLGTDIQPENRGFVPGPDYYNRLWPDFKWNSKTIFSLGIGQGELGVTPMHMANLSAIIANRGYYITPHIIKGVEQNGNVSWLKFEKNRTLVDGKHFDFVANAMQDVVDAGTARLARIKGLEVCGKTGTAQNPHGEDHSVFIAFAPKDNPKIAVAVYVENAGFGGTWAAPIASLVIEKYLQEEIERKWIENYVLEGDLIN